MKMCPKCGESKPATTEYFHRNKQTKDGFRCWCKVCTKMANTQYNKKNPEKAVSRVLRSRRKCKQRMATHVDSQTKYRKSESGYYKYRNGVLLRNYGITLVEYNDLILQQEGGCAICGKTAEDEKKNLSVDHCHENGSVRGILCTNCNNGLGKFKDSLVLLNKAYEYLRRFYENSNPH